MEVVSALRIITFHLKGRHTETCQAIRLGWVNSLVSPGNFGLVNESYAPSLAGLLSDKQLNTESIGSHPTFHWREFSPAEFVSAILLGSHAWL